MLPRLSLVPRFTLAFATFAALLLLVFGAFVFVRSQQVLQQTATAELLGDVQEKEEAVSGWVDDGQNGLGILADSLENDELAALNAAAPDSADARLVRQRLGAELQTWVKSGRYTQLLIIEAGSGRVLAANDPMEEGKSKTDAPFFLNGQAGPYLQPPLYSPQQQTPIIMIARPLASHERRVVGVLAAQLNLVELGRIIARRTETHPTKDAYLVSSNNLFVTQPRFVSDPATLASGNHTPAVLRCLQQQSGTTTEPDYRGVSALIAYRWLADKQLCLVTQIDEADALSPVRTMSTNLLVGSIAALFVGSLLALALAQTIVRPIRILQRGAARFAEGDLEVRLPENAVDELGQLAHDFNGMAAALAVQQANQRAYAMNLEQRVSERTEALAKLNAELEQRVSERGQQLLESEQKFSLAFRSSPSGIIITRISDGQIVEVNNAYMQMTGYSRGELVGQEVIALGIVTPPDRQRVLDMLREKGYVRDLEMTLGNKTGPRVEVLASAERIMLDGEACLVAITHTIGERKRAERAILRRNAELAALNQMGQAMSRLTEQRALLELFETTVGQILGKNNLYIALYDANTQTISFPAYQKEGRRIDRQSRAMGNGVTEFVIRTRAPLFLPNEVAEGLAERGIAPLGQPAKSYLAVPMLIGESILGVIAVQDYEHVNAFDQGDLEVLSTLAAQAAIALENTRLFEETRLLSRMDALTGIANRRHLAETGEREVRRALRFHHPLSLIMVDIDHFKTVNDTYGHAIGDQVLQAIAKSCGQEVRDSDIIARYGGEEFVVISVETDPAGTRQLAERMRARVAGLIVGTDAANINVTISLGVATLDPNGDSLEALLARADQALYAAKSAGRNTVR